LAWWFDFIFTKLNAIRPSTCALIRVLDARHFAKDAYHFASDESARTLQESFTRALHHLPQINSIMVDGHADLDPRFLGLSSADDNTCPLLLLSIAHCPYQLPSTFFSSPSLQGLIYLDISEVPGSISPLIQPALLPSLRILKIRGREIDNATFSALVSLYRLRLWSLDISDNRISDHVIDMLTSHCFSVAQLRSPAHFRVEGKLILEDKGTPQYGPFMTVEESEWSGTFDHPERYFADSPMYQARPDQGLREHQTFRSDCLEPIRQDTADAASAVLSEGEMAVEDVPRPDALPSFEHQHIRRRVREARSTIHWPD
jgi:hypothetical protein